MRGIALAILFFTFMYAFYQSDKDGLLVPVFILFLASLVCIVGGW